MRAPRTSRAVVAAWLAGLCWLTLARAAAGQEPGGGAADIGQLRDITGIESLPPAPAPPRWPYGLAAGILAALGLAIVSWKWSRLAARPAPAPTPAEWARHELDRVEGLALPQSGDAERYSNLISQVVRHYLHLHFALHAPRQTTAEFVAAVRNDTRLLPEEQELLRRLLEQCDLAKFARSAFSVEECAELLAMARRFVAETSAPSRATEARKVAERNGAAAARFCFDSHPKKE
jgi:hypothetical protein